jgi:hypothetical protein
MVMEYIVHLEGRLLIMVIRYTVFLEVGLIGIIKIAQGTII